MFTPTHVITTTFLEIKQVGDFVYPAIKKIFKRYVVQKNGSKFLTQTDLENNSYSFETDLKGNIKMRIEEAHRVLIEIQMQDIDLKYRPPPLPPKAKKSDDYLKEKIKEITTEDIEQIIDKLFGG